MSTNVSMQIDCTGNRKLMQENKANYRCRCALQRDFAVLTLLRICMVVGDVIKYYFLVIQFVYLSKV